jgi:hypothetical protein
LARKMMTQEKEFCRKGEQKGFSKKMPADLMADIRQYLPAFPACILVITNDDDSHCAPMLKAQGYQFDIRSASDLFKNPFGSNTYIGAVILELPEDVSGAYGLIGRVGDALKHGGRILIASGPFMEEDSLNDSFPSAFGKIRAALYESGISGRRETQRLWVGRKTGIFLRHYQPGDETHIVSMFREIFNDERSMDHWYWKFRDNPFGDYKIAQAVSDDGVVAGHYSGYPVPFFATARQGASFLSLQIGDIMTQPGFRNVGLGKTSVLGRITDYFHQEFCVGQIPFMYGFVAGKHRRFGKRFLGYRYMSGVSFFVLDLKKKIIKETGRIRRFFSGVKIEEIHDMSPPVLNPFFYRAARDYDLLVKRNADYLRWRYGNCPDGGYRFFAVKQFGRLVGWAVFKRKGNVLVWGDALFLKSKAGLARAMIFEVIRKYPPSIERIESWFSLKPRWWSDILREIGFEQKNEPNGLTAGVTIFDRSTTVGFVKEHLYYTMGDSDLF